MLNKFHLYLFQLLETYIALATIIIQFVIPTIEIADIFKVLAVSKSKLVLFGVESWSKETHDLELKSYPERHISQIELLVLMHFFQLEDIQLSTVSFIKFWTGAVTPAIEEFIQKSNSVSDATCGALTANTPVEGFTNTQEGGAI